MPGDSPWQDLFPLAPMLYQLLPEPFFLGNFPACQREGFGAQRLTHGQAIFELIFTRVHPMQSQMTVRQELELFMTLQANDPITLDGVLRREFPYPLTFIAETRHAGFEHLKLLEDNKNLFDAFRDLLRRHRGMADLGRNNF